MSSSPKPIIVIASLQVQSSFQAVPLGAACIVSALRADMAISAAADIRLFDCSLEDSDFSGFQAGSDAASVGGVIARKIAAFCTGPSAIVGLSVYVWNRLALEAAARELRTLVPGIVIFAGGPEVSASTRSFESGLFDHLVCGEGEQITVSFCHALLSSGSIPCEITSLSRLPGLDCATLSSPWLDGTLDDCASVRECRGALWELARGCPYNCTYCYESKGEKKVRLFPLERLEKELDYFVATGIERVFVLDPTYNASRERALTLLRLIEKKAPELHFNFEVRAELLDREMVEAFGKIPCSLQIGLQSTNPEALKLVNRPVDLSAFSKKIGLLNDEGVVFGLDLMFGLPGDSLSTFRAGIDYAVGLYPNNLEIFRLAVLPGTLLAEQAESLGVKHKAGPPYHVESTPKFPAADLERAAAIGRACDIFYTQGRAVSWFLSALHPIKLKPAQFFQDFARFLSEDTTLAGVLSVACEATVELTQKEAEKLQLDFVDKKYREKEKAFLLPVLRDIIVLNGAWTRALAEGEESKLSLSYHPDDLMSPDAMDIEYFNDNAYMENCTVRVFAGADGPEMEIR